MLSLSEHERKGYPAMLRYAHPAKVRQAQHDTIRTFKFRNRHSALRISTSSA